MSKLGSHNSSIGNKYPISINLLYDEKKFAITGIDTNVQYQLGQNVKVKVKSADLEKKQLNFLIV